MDDSSPEHNAESPLKGFTAAFALSQGVGLTAIIVTGVWCGSYLNGFAWTSDPGLEFNFHPLFMVIGMVFCYGEGIMAYRVLRNERKRTLKLVHFALLSLSIIFTSIALKAVFDSHNLKKPNPIPNLYSAHSWMGITTVALFCLQLICGFLTFLFPGFRSLTRANYLSWHTTFGLIIFFFAIATCLMGITEKAFFSLKNYSELPQAGVIVNVLVLLLVIFGALVGFLVGNPAYRRVQLPEDEITLLTRSFE